MSSQQDPAGDREVFRSTGSLILWWLWAVFAAVTLADLIVQGSGHSAVIMAVLVVAITALVYGCAFRPRIVADAGGITIENPLRDHRVPWGAVEKVDAVHAVRVHCVAGTGRRQGQDHQQLGRAVLAAGGPGRGVPVPAAGPAAGAARPVTAATRPRPRRPCAAASPRPPRASWTSG